MNRVIDKNDLPGIIAALDDMAGHEVEAGIFGMQADDQVGNSGITMRELAVILHEGCRIKVTPKMRAFLAAKGLYLKQSTKYINIPPRPFIDPAMDKAEKVAFRIIGEAVDQLIESKGKATGRTGWERLGLELVGLIKKEMVDLRNPPNHPFTIAMKGSDNPLIDHGHLLRSVVHEVRQR